ncbi:MAG: hypothetical protein DWQ01_09070 [Planctomycetota bacterium]|nr:MAG: hypothetical protein DWQ01_09070 [Planctomycetota bacterium]
MFFFLAPTALATPQRIHFLEFETGNQMRVQEADPNGSLIQTCGPYSAGRLLAVDDQAGMLYWTDKLTQSIRRMPLDCQGGPVDLCSSSSPYGIDLDLINGYIYWTDDYDRNIQRSTLDGSNCTVLCNFSSIPTGTLRGIAVDPLGGKIYWPEKSSGNIYSADLLCQNVQTLITGRNGNRFVDIEVDPVGGRLFWIESGEVYCFDFATSTITLCISKVGFGLTGLAYESSSDQLYLSSSGSSGTSLPRLLVGDLATGATTTIYQHVNGVSGVAVSCSEPFLHPPDPGMEGMDNLFRVTCAEPFAPVYFYYGFQPGSTPVNHACGALTLDLDSAVALGSTTADANGLAELSLSVPAGLQRQSFLFQAVDDQRCQLTNTQVAEFNEVDFWIDWPSPGLASQINTIQISAAPANANLSLYYSFQMGSSSGIHCPGDLLDLATPVLFATVTTDGSGEASVANFVPGSAAGRTFFLQAQADAGCETSNVVQIQFE